MTESEYLTQLKKSRGYTLIKDSIDKNELKLAILGIGRYRQTPSDEFLNIYPNVIYWYLHLFITEGRLTNFEINDAFRQITIHTKEDVWLLMLYVEAALIYNKNRTMPIVELDIDYLINKINEVWETYKNDYTVKKYAQNINMIMGKSIFEMN